MLVPAPLADPTYLEMIAQVCPRSGDELSVVLRNNCSRTYVVCNLGVEVGLSHLDTLSLSQISRGECVAQLVLQRFHFPLDINLRAGEVVDTDAGSVPRPRRCRPSLQQRESGLVEIRALEHLRTGTLPADDSPGRDVYAAQAVYIPPGEKRHVNLGFHAQCPPGKKHSLIMLQSDFE